ncbi:MAG: class I SAM-dependent methyltransferase [Verrucomicrobiota bacterium]
MKTKILEVLQCPRCSSSLAVTSFEENQTEIRSGRLACTGSEGHVFEIQDGIIRFATGFDHEAVKRELEYENSTYKGSDRLTDAKLIAQFPETLAELWPHTCHFGPDFKVLIDHLNCDDNSWILDIGTGPCWSSRLLAQRGGNVIALDVNEANYYGLKTSDILFEAHGVYFERILESMTNLPFQNESIDCITFNASFHHTPDHHQTLSECFRVLRPGGKIAMVNEEFASLRHRLLPPGEATDSGSHHSIRYSDFEKSVQESGFTLKYFVAEHVREKLKNKLSDGLGNRIISTLEQCPVLLKQLNSALVILGKPSAPVARLETTPSIKPSVLQS